MTPTLTPAGPFCPNGDHKEPMIPFKTHAQETEYRCRKKGCTIQRFLPLGYTPQPAKPTVDDL